ncbi:TetR/AcrR family transcriptional regulator [Steroidobacter sp.]|uniref:TetR/AcrR family transcriptional regulator n=1 Tax=Steroidobacter sp. TaxID=1978227 RepID=UPI001A550C7F|nr:TetR/AcrR family transcriptional regulator [Steroidobacter sp.]MBL8267961.1 TetR/AcrR family transcriptional regulator [Steroidobacter sp.]
MSYKRSFLMQERLADNRQRILKAARALVAEGGFGQASIAAVAASAGLSAGAIYRYFPSKAALFVEVLTGAIDHEIVILQAIAKGEGNATSRLRACVESFANRALEGPYLAYAFIAEPAEQEVDEARLLGRIRFGEVFKSLLIQGIESGEFPEQSVDIGAACIVGAFTEALIRPITPRGKRDARTEMVEGIVAFCLRAVGAKVTTKKAGRAKD